MKFQNKQQLVDYLIQECNDTVCTDIVRLESNQTKQILDIWEHSGGIRKSEDKYNGTEQIPADIYYVNTIPLKDLTINLGGEFDYRVRIWDAFEKGTNEYILDRLGVDECPIGIVETTTPLYKDIHIIHSLFLTREIPDAIIPCFSGSDTTERSKAMYENERFKKEIFSNVRLIMEVWYGIQICLLNPETRVIFSKPALTKLHGKEKVKAQKQDKTIKYIKTYYIKDKDFDNVFYGGDRTINRKCLVWYVTGHWREYKSGKRVFIQGFWKGKLRNTPPNDIEPRNRELVIKKRR